MTLNRRHTNHFLFSIVYFTNEAMYSQKRTVTATTLLYILAEQIQKLILVIQSHINLLAQIQFRFNNYLSLVFQALGQSFFHM